MADTTDKRRRRPGSEPRYPVQVWVPESLHAKVAEAADRRKTTMAGWVREAMRAQLDKEKETP